MSATVPDEWRPPRLWPELDLLRALAGVLMVLNHAGVSWLHERSSDVVDDVLVYAGGLAPVLFFAAAGIGRGIQSVVAPSARPFADTAHKALVLFVADAALWLSPSTWIGMDFLGFIALSILAVELVDRSTHPRLAALGGIAICLGLRFGLAPSLQLPPDGNNWLTLFHVVLGDYPVAGVSYPLCPWLAFPLLGYLIGEVAATHARHVLTRRAAYAGSLLLLAAAGFAFCFILERRGMVFFRWGSMSFAYSVLAFSAVFAALAVVLLIPALFGPRLTSALGLSGPSSFVLVPIHYGVIALVHATALDVVRLAFPLAAAVVIALVIALSRIIAAGITTLVRSNTSYRVLAFCWLSMFAFLFSLHTVETNRLLLTIPAQLLACAVFVITSRYAVRPRIAVPI